MNTNKIDLIKAEVERLQIELIQEKENGFGSDTDDACILELQNVLTYIDSMQEEPVSVWHDASKYPLTGKEIIVFRDNKMYYGKYIGGFHRYVRAEIQLTHDTAQTYAIIDNLTKKDKWIYVEDLLNLSNVEKTGKEWKEEPVSEELEKAARSYSNNLDNIYGSIGEQTKNAFKAGAKWQKEHLWKDAQGDDLPEIDREVIAFQETFPIDVDVPSLFKIVIAHRPNPKGYDGKSIATGKVEHYTPKIYDKGGWNIPNVALWLDLNIPNLEED